MLSQAGKDAVAMLLPFAKGSQAATAEVYALAQQAGYQGAPSFKALADWVGKTHDPMANLDKITGQLTIDASNLTQDVKNLSLALGTNLNQAMAAAIFQATGGQRAFDDFATSVLRTGANSRTTRNSAAVLAGQLIATLGDARQAKTEFEAFAINGLHLTKQNADALWNSLKLQQLTNVANKAGETRTQFEHLAAQLGISKQAADNLWTSLHKVAAGSPYTAQEILNGKGQFTISQLQAAGGLGIQGPPPGVAAPHKASGGVIGPGHGGGDRRLFWGEPGEVVVPVDMVNHGAVDHLRGRLPGFASGGQIGSAAALPGRATGFFNDFTSQFEGAMKNAMTGAMSKAIQQAQVAMISTAGVSNASAVAALKSAAAKYGWNVGAEWTALNNVEMREAGYRLNAQNPHSAAYGMAQFINGPSEYYQYGGNPNTAAGQAVAMINYIRSRYGDPIAAWNHELSAGWYDQGGILPPGLTLAFNGTGHNEHVVGPEWIPPTVFGGEFGRTGGGIGSLFQRLESLLDSLDSLVGSLSGASGGAAFPGGGVGDFMGVVSPAGGGFGLTRGDIGLPAQPPSDTGSSGSDGSGGDTGSGGGNPPPKKPKGPNASQLEAITLLKQLIGGYIWHNEVGKAKQANALLNWLGVGHYNGQLSEITYLDDLLLKYQKAHKTKAVAATETLLRAQGVHVFQPKLHAAGNDPRTRVLRKLTALMLQDIAANNLGTMFQINSLLDPLGDHKFDSQLGQINRLDALLAKYKKSKDVKDEHAVEVLLRQLGVKKFDSGGPLPQGVHLTMNASGGTEEVLTPAERRAFVALAQGRGGSDTHSKQLVQLMGSLLRVAQQQPSAMAGGVSSALNGGIRQATFRKRYPRMGS